MTNLRVWIHKERMTRFADEQAHAYSSCMRVYSFPVLTTDLCYELVPVSSEQLEREAKEAIDEGNKNA